MVGIPKSTALSHISLTYCIRILMCFSNCIFLNPFLLTACCLSSSFLVPKLVGVVDFQESGTSIRCCSTRRKQLLDDVWFCFFHVYYCGNWRGFYAVFLLVVLRLGMLVVVRILR
jgi:hypothetical protein